jgi:Ca-activated chloride channel family protein
VTTEVGPAPWDPRRRLVHIGLQGKAARDGLPTRNLVFLIDVSGSMDSEDKLPLVKQGLAALTEQLGERDRIAIVVYAGAAGAVLPPTAGDEKEAILAALHGLESGGSTNGAEGIELAYALAERHFVDGGVNRVILATDGDFNVGVSSDEELERLIERKRESGVFLSVLGVGTGNLNDRMMEQLADKGNGNYAYLDGPLEARKVLVEEASATLDAIAKDVKVQVAFDPALVKAHRLVGYENRKLAHRDFDDDRKDAGEIGAGHSVTALYEIVPTSALENDASFMTLDLRWKEPDANTSTKLSFTVRDFGHGLDDTSDDFRFSAAVAAFAQKLRSAEPEAKMTYSDVLALAGTALGEDPDCYRRELLELVWLAASHAGEELERPERPGCEPAPLPPAPAVTPAHAASRPAPDPSWDWGAFALEVLRLLPPLLALPLFVLAFRRPRRRR